MSNLVGQTLNRYQLLSLLGEGGMGAVYLGQDLTLERDVAVKVMHPHFARNPEFRERFLQEARVAARLNHPGIVKVYDFGESSDGLYIVMEFIKGSNLAEMLHSLRQKAQWIVLPEAIELLRQIALALDYAHRQGILHRDIKPANIMLRSEAGGPFGYQPVITDLGLAKLSEGGVETQTGSSMGTPAYMSPEQAIGTTTDERSDVYSLGVLLFELVLGQRPFPISTLSQAIEYHGKQPPPDPVTLRPDIAPALAAILLKALAKKPEQRYHSTAELAQALASLPAETVIATAPPTAKAGAAGLMTQYQESLIQRRGRSILDEFPSVATGAGQIQLLTPDGKARTLELSTRLSIIGRDSTNTIVLNDEKASRQHARIEFDGTQWKVTDLNSRNGTYLGNDKLLPGVPQVWNVNQALRIGGHYLRIVPGQTMPDSLAGTLAYASQLSDAATQASATMQSKVADLAIYGVPDRVEIEAGGMGNVPVIVINQGAQVKHVMLAIEGQAAQWTQASPTMQLMPGEQKDIVFVVRPPRNAATQSGDYPLRITISGQDQPSQTFTKAVVVCLLPYHAFQSELRPLEGRAGQSMKVLISNQGNAKQNYRLQWQDRADEIEFVASKSQLTVGAGESVAVDFVPKVRRRRLVSAEKQHSFTTQVSSDNGETVPLAGTVISKGSVPPWLPPILGLLLVGVAALGGYVIQQQNQASREATAAAIVLKMDSDGDSLTNGEEKTWGSNPDVPDSDGDGLSDGVEVKTTHTSPINPDTDGDGLNDKVDPDPQNLPTPTWTSTIAPVSATITPVPPPTITPVPPPTTPAAPVVSVQSVADFSGTWFTNFAEVHMSQNGNQVSGQYQWYGNNNWWTISGTVDDQTLTGQYNVPPEVGQLVFFMDTSTHSFDGYWIKQGSAVHRHWCGVPSGPLPDGCGFSGSWLAKSTELNFQWQPTMQLSQEGSTVVGTFDNGNPNGTGTIRGQIGSSGNTPHYNLVGNYSVDADGFTASARWTLLDSHDRQFVGCSISFGEVVDWLGWRQGESEPASDHPQSCP